MSEAASGPLGPDFNISIARGRAYLRRNPSVVPDPTLPQIVHRTMMAFLCPRWGELSNAAKDTWIVPAKANDVAPYHAYLTGNLRRWAHRSVPATEYPIEETGPNTLIHAFTATAGVGECVIEYKRFFAPWGAIIYRDTSWPDPVKDLTIAIVFPHIQGVTTTWIDRPLEPDVYYYRILPFSEGGRPGTLSAIAWDRVT